MAVPAHDQRDHDFARAFGLEIREVIARRRRRPGRALRGRRADASTAAASTGSTAATRIARSSSGCESEGKGEPAVNYRLRDWLLSRQRYWGCPIPILYCEACGMLPVPDDQLPVELPEVEDFSPKGQSPLAAVDRLGQHHLPELRRTGAARDRHDGHLRRLVLVLPALPRPPQRRAPVGSRAGRLLDADRPVHRRGRARDPAPALLALLLQGALRHRRARPPGAVQQPLRPGDDHPRRAPRCRSRRATRSIRPSTSSATAPTPCAPTSASSAPPTATPTGSTRGSRGCSAS